MPTATPTEIREHIEKRRTFAIISHPDAGKTTLTEKLLLYGGAIHLAGSVKARKTNRHAVSDWMDIEKQRGISVTSSAMQFQYNGYHINILDTPGHQDFSEDTYRTLVAADSAVMLIDGAKGVEPQTIKLFQVCRRRNIPIFTFVNKMDRAARSPFDLMAELEDVLGITSCPMHWPIGTDGDFKGIYHRDTGMVEAYLPDDSHGMKKVDSVIAPPDDPRIRSLIGDYLYKKLKDELELLDGAGDDLDIDRVLRGELTPLFFGSAMNSFGVESFLNHFLSMTTPPLSRHASVGDIDPLNPEFSAFVFKIQANMNPAHRDRLAFIRICSGKFTKGMDAFHMQEGKDIRMAQPQQFMAQDRESVEEAWPGDIIGLFDPGVFRLGDTLLTGGEHFTFDGIPLFAPEHFARVAPEDTLKRKQFLNGVNQLSEEGAIQTFRRVDSGTGEQIVGVVGALQFEVLEYRLKNEYGVQVKLETLPFRFVRWITGGVPPDRLQLASTTRLALDSRQRPVLLFENEWSIRWALENNKGLSLQDIAPRDEGETV